MSWGLTTVEKEQKTGSVKTQISEFPAEMQLLG